MSKTITAAAVVGVLSLATVPAFAQSAAAPEPPQGAQPMDNPGSGSMEKGGSMEKSSMKKGSMKKKKSMKHMHKKAM